MEDAKDYIQIPKRDAVEVYGNRTKLLVAQTTKRMIVVTTSHAT